MSGEQVEGVVESLEQASERLTSMVGHLQQAFQAASDAALLINNTCSAVRNSMCDHSEHTGYYRSDVKGKLAFWCKKCQTEQLIDESEVD